MVFFYPFGVSTSYRTFWREIRKSWLNLLVFTFRFIDDVFSLNNSMLNASIQLNLIEIKDTTETVRFSPQPTTSLIEGFLKEKLKSLLRNFFGRHHDLVERHEIFTSPMTMDIFLPAVLTTNLLLYRLWLTPIATIHRFCLLSNIGVRSWAAHELNLVFVVQCRIPMWEIRSAESKVTRQIWNKV